MSDLLNKVKELLENAEYKHGGQGEDSNGNDKLEYDCSGVVIDALNKLGYNIPDMSAGDMQNSGYFDGVQTSQVEPGDIIVTKNANGGWHTAVVNEDTSRFVGAQSSNVWDQPFGPNAPYWNKPFIILRPKPNLIPNDAPDEPRDGFNDAKTTRSPIVLDLDGDGIKTFGTDAGIHFDHDGNGFKELSGWIAGGDGLLMIDRNANNVLDSGNELFGNYTPLSDGKLAINGFQALTQFDVNGDGKIDADDPIWSQLRIWQHDPEATDLGDPDSSGIIKTLSELGIQSIDTGYTNANITDANGNIIKQTGTFTWEDGTTGTAADVWFQTDNMHTIANEWLDVPDDIATLPNMWGYGNVYDLHQAMVRDESGQLSDFWR